MCVPLLIYYYCCPIVW